MNILRFNLLGASLFLPIAAAAIGSLVALPAAAAGDDEFLETATVAQLDEAGYIIHGNDDFGALRVNFQRAMDLRADAVASLWQAAFGQEAAEIEALGDLLGFSDTLQLVEVIPETTGQVGKPTIIMDLDDLSTGPDLGALSAGPPTKGSLASWKLLEQNEAGAVWGHQETDSEGNVKVTERVYDSGGNLTMVIVTESMANGTVRESVTVEGKPPVTEVTETAGGVDVTGVTPVTPEEVPIPKGKIAGLPTEDGDVTYCPLYIPACRAAAEEAEEQASSATYLVSGFVFIDPGPDGAAPMPVAPKVVTNPESCAVNTDPNAWSGEYGSPPTAFEIEFPVVVLPPKPNT
ncbi:MAG: hypothetical protein AAF721_03025 [Myxococcota bacterium]